MIMHNELGRTAEEFVMAYFKVIFQRSFGVLRRTTRNISQGS
jgi:hypothetical protein